MDTPSVRSAHDKLVTLALTLGALATMIVLILMWQGGLFGGGGRGGFVDVILSPDAYPPHAVQVARGNGMQPLSIEGQGTATLYAEERTETYAYYLMSGPEANQSTLYRQNLANPSAGLEQMTSSKNLKLELSVHESAGVAAYTARSEGGETSVMVLDLKTQLEKRLGGGADPHVLADGLSVLFEREGVLRAADIATGEERTILRIGNAAVYAVDSVTSQVGVYDAATNTLTNHWIESTGTGMEARAGATVTPPHTPQKLFYKDGELFAAYMEQDILFVYAVNGSREGSVSVPGFSLEGYRITPL